MSAYDMVNKVISEKLMEGVVPWKKLWKTKGGLPAISLNSGKPYNGINQLLLTCLADQFNESPYFLTYKQAVARGGYIKSGEKGFHVVFFKKSEDADEKEMEDEDKKAKFILRYYTIFNLEQCENITLTAKEKQLLKSMEVTPNNNKSIKRAEQLLNSYYKLPDVVIKQSHNPSYNFNQDIISMPPIVQFETSEEYYASLFHEVIHSTGHKTRLKRKLESKTIQDKTIEELIAEIGSAYLSSDAGIVDKVIDNNASYINYWLDRINVNKRLFVTATSRAEKAYKFIKEHSVKKKKQAMTA